MESPIKEGILHIQQYKFGMKVWKKNWSILYPASSYSIARLEQFVAKDFSNYCDRHIQKRVERIIRLSDCISINRNQVENSPKEMSAFCITTTEKTYIMAAPKQDVTEWIKCLCELAFQNTSVKKRNEDVSASSCMLPSDSLMMEENELYSTITQAAPVHQFTVTVQKTDAATRCKLHGKYILIPGKNCLILEDPKTKQDVYRWPYRYLRRYGMDQTTFTFEAGRRCDSGQGLFLFNTKDVREIFRIIDTAVKEKEQQRLSLTSVGSASSRAFSLQLSNTSTSSQESLDEKSQGGRMPVLKDAQDTVTSPKITKMKNYRDRKGQTSPCGVVSKAATVGERNVPTTNEREGADAPCQIIYATVKHSKGQSKKGKVEESPLSLTKYDSYSDDSLTDPVYENVSDIESLLSFEEEPSFLKDIQGPIYQNSGESHGDQNIPFLMSISASDYENIVTEWSQQTTKGDHVEDTVFGEESEQHPAVLEKKNKEEDISLNPGMSKSTKAKFPAGIQEMLSDLYSKELSKTREGKVERAGRASELQKK
ncbi:docking protein 3-like [Heterodontus francisci]|uniref:docking protein 3-like n=1 Tax=Heterodontus francisci TaxID=7792 RepID=UPI00355C9C58